jgi:hypothetical protein
MKLFAGENVNHLAVARQPDVGFPVKGPRVTGTFMRTRNTVRKQSNSKPTPKRKASASSSARCLSILLIMQRDGKAEMAQEIASRWRKNRKGL